MKTIRTIAILFIFANSYFIGGIKWMANKLGWRYTFFHYMKKRREANRKEFGFVWYVVKLKHWGYECVSEHWIQNRQKKDYEIAYRTN